eukprot:7370601-Pyramimonas_sp.AAC.1
MHLYTSKSPKNSERRPMSASTPRLMHRMREEALVQTSRWFDREIFTISSAYMAQLSLGICNMQVWSQCRLVLSYRYECVWQCCHMGASEYE